MAPTVVIKVAFTAKHSQQDFASGSAGAVVGAQIGDMIRNETRGFDFEPPNYMLEWNEVISQSEYKQLIEIFTKKHWEKYGKCADCCCEQWCLSFCLLCIPGVMRTRKVEGNNQIVSARVVEELKQFASSHGLTIVVTPVVYPKTDYCGCCYKQNVWRVFTVQLQRETSSFAVGLVASQPLPTQNMENNTAPLDADVMSLLTQTQQTKYAGVFQKQEIDMQTLFGWHRQGKVEDKLVALDVPAGAANKIANGVANLAQA